MDKKRQDCAEGELNSTLCTQHMLGNGYEDTDIRCLLTNVRSIMNKFAELKDFIDQHNPYIIGITETWCTDLVSDAELSLGEYNLFRCDRKNAPGGGVLLCVHLSLNAVICESLTKLDIKDSVWCIVTLRDKTKMLIGVVYRSPSSNSENDAKLITTISNIEDYHDCADLLLMGDFNTPNVDWKDFTCSDSRSSFARNFINATLDSYLTQHIYKPTRHVPGQKSSILDLVFTPNPNSVVKIQHCSPLGFSDHECLLFEVKYVME